MTVQCEWFVKCTRQTNKGASHPILGIVPICGHCADAMEITPEFQLPD